MPRLYNPYVNLLPRERHRISVDVPRHVATEIKKVLPEHGSLNKLVAMFINHLYDYATKHDLAYSRDGTDRLVGRILDVCAACGEPRVFDSARGASGGPASESPRQGPDGNV